MSKQTSAFTLVEMLVAVTVLTLVVLLVTRLITAASAVATLGNARMDVDSQARPALNRMAIDFEQMVRRTDVDYYLKSDANPETGNDQIAFYSGVPGYGQGSQSSISLVAYRVNSDSASLAFRKFERLGKGLQWNGASTSNTPIVFLPLTIASNWPAATNTSADPLGDYEVIASGIFRFEYYYLLKNGTLSITPWDTGAGHTSAEGVQDVTAISVAIAIIDAKHRGLLTDTQVATLTTGMVDFSTTMTSGDLLTQWQTSLGQTTGMPRAALASIRLYQRSLYLHPNHQ